VPAPRRSWRGEMESILIVGIHTRPAVSSAKRLGLKVYSVDYFGDVDLKAEADASFSIQKQEPERSCGRLSENYSDAALRKLAEPLDADATLLTSTLDLQKPDIIGNPPGLTSKLKDKAHQLRRAAKLGVRVPESAVVRDRQDAIDAVKGMGLPVILKPVRGAGGRKVRLIKALEELPELEEEMLVQEYVEGTPVSVSILASSTECRALSTSTQILGAPELNQSGFAYCGSLTPCPAAEGLRGSAEELGMAFGVTGWNGLDFVLGKEPCFMELNPRFQGTFDCVEESYGMNLVEAHIRACRGEPIEIPEPDASSCRLTLYAGQRYRVMRDLRGTSRDVPMRHCIIEAGEPITTVITTDRDGERALNFARKTARRIYANFIKPV